MNLSVNLSIQNENGKKESNKEKEMEKRKKGKEKIAERYLAAVPCVCLFVYSPLQEVWECQDGSMLVPTKMSTSLRPQIHLVAGADRQR